MSTAFDPYLVHLEVAEGELCQPRVLVVADVILGVGALALAPLEHGDIRIGLIGQECLEAVAVQINERGYALRGAPARVGR